MGLKLTEDRRAHRDEKTGIEYAIEGLSGGTPPGFFRQLWWYVRVRFLGLDPTPPVNRDPRG